MSFLRRIAIPKILRKRSKCVILGIETSCDDTGCAIINGDGDILGETVLSQSEMVVQQGGIMPAIARDLHKDCINDVVNKTLKSACTNLHNIDAIAVTTRPGMTLSLVVGMNYAKTLSLDHNIPLIPIHHMQAHALTGRLLNKDITYPFLTLLISGAHCLLSLAQSVDKFFLLGYCLDDGPGEAFDKIGRRLKLRNLPGYRKCSAGSAIEKMATGGNAIAYEFTPPMSHYRNCNFSFSGMKTAAKSIIREEEMIHNVQPDGVIPTASDLCASFQYAIALHLCRRLQRAIEYIEMNGMMGRKKYLVVSGGAASNKYLNRAVSVVCREKGYEHFTPPPKYCTDNGVMIAWNGVERFKADFEIYQPNELDQIDAVSREDIGEDLSKDIDKRSIRCDWISLKELLEANENDEPVFKRNAL